MEPFLVAILPAKTLPGLLLALRELMNTGEYIQWVAHDGDELKTMGCEQALEGIYGVPVNL